MGWLLLVIALLFVFIFLKQKPSEDLSRGKREILPYRKREYLLSKDDRFLYDILTQLCQNRGYKLFAKVRMSDVVYLPKGTENQQSYWNKIQGKSVDFLVCDGQYLRPLFVIELGSSTSSKNEFVEKALTDAGLLFVRIPQQQVNSKENIFNLLSPVFSRVEAAASK